MFSAWVPFPEAGAPIRRMHVSALNSLLDVVTTIGSGSETALLLADPQPISF